MHRAQRCGGRGGADRERCNRSRRCPDRGESPRGGGQHGHAGNRGPGGDGGLGYAGQNPWPAHRPDAALGADQPRRVPGHRPPACGHRAPGGLRSAGRLDPGLGSVSWQPSRPPRSSYPTRRSSPGAHPR
ncbi:MAG: hypothetical protein M3400_13850 [Actinomycetota bacterium]|nr:hypothetical protein [Actinomycetota bacterium]